MIIEFLLEVGATGGAGGAVRELKERLGTEDAVRELKERLGTGGAVRELKEKPENICFQSSKFFAILHLSRIELLILSNKRSRLSY